MTGFGDARFHSDALNVAFELRAVNNRYLKVTLRAPEPYHLLEAEVEKVVRRRVRRGTIQVHLHCQRQYSSQDFQVNAMALRSYLRQLKDLCQELGVRESVEGMVSQLLALPGVVAEPASASLDLEKEWPVMERVLEEALARLQTMRQEEGKAMARELLVHRQFMMEQLDEIRQRSPSVVETHRDRLLERVRTLLKEVDVQLDSGDLIKEVSIFAERSDIAEEVVRLASHFDQFQEIIKEPESAGRKLEFLTQEMFREANTIGSKASDVDISRRVVEIKGTLEKVRELVQNIE
jgi:uncharacterized protein (TIGR00255 family)